MGKYDALLQLPHPDPERHPRMSPQARAAQFAPFAALRGYEEELDDAAQKHAESQQLQYEEMEEEC